MTVMIVPTEWSCPNCPVTVVKPLSKGTLFHTCAGLRGLSAPLLPKGTKAKVEAVEREDYVGNEMLRLHGGRPVMAVKTTRDDGQDVAVFAGTARGGGKASR